MMTVTVQHCYGDRETLTSRHRTDSRAEAIRRAVAKHYGAAAELERDHGISNTRTDYGQIGVPCSTGGRSLITGRVAIRAEQDETTTAAAIRQAGQDVRLEPWGSQYRVSHGDGSPDSNPTNYAQAVSWCRTARVCRVLELLDLFTDDPQYREALAQYHAAQPGRWEDAARDAVGTLAPEKEAAQ